MNEFVATLSLQNDNETYLTLLSEPKENGSDCCLDIINQITFLLCLNGERQFDEEAIEPIINRLRKLIND